MDKPTTIVVRSWQEAFQQSDVNATTQHVCYTIETFVGRNGKGCWPSFEAIAARAKLSRRTVIASIKKAVSAGLLGVERRKGVEGRQIANFYRLTFPRNMVLPHSDDGECGAPLDITGGVHVVHPPSARAAPQYLDNSTLPKKGGRVASSNTQDILKKPETPPTDETTFDGATITLDSKNRAFWLERFDGDATRLDLALTTAAAYVQANGNRSLIVQVNAQLARQCADKRDRDKRHASTLKTKPGSTAKEPSPARRLLDEMAAEERAAS